MRHANLILIAALAAALAPVAPARADFVGLTVVREFPNQTVVLGVVRDVFRVYAEFTNPNDRVDTWFGTSANPFVIQNVLADGSPGSGFFQAGATSSFPPEAPGSPLDWDTWATIGSTWEGENGVGSNLSWSPVAFPAFINGNSLTAAASVFLLTEFPPQGLGSFRVTGEDTATRVLLMQLTVMPGEHVQGVVSVGGRISIGEGYIQFVAATQTFSSIPTAGAWPMLVAVMGVRRHRRHH